MKFSILFFKKINLKKLSKVQQNKIKNNNNNNAKMVKVLGYSGF